MRFRAPPCELAPGAPQGKWRFGAGILLQRCKFQSDGFAHRANGACEAVGHAMKALKGV